MIELLGDTFFIVALGLALMVFITIAWIGVALIEVGGVIEEERHREQTSAE